MADNTPLDADLVFEPSDDDRPAGEWMEGYWAQAVPWAKRFAFAVWAYVALQVYSESRVFAAAMLGEPQLFIGLLGIGLAYCPVAGLGYFLFRFGRDLEGALAGGDQMLLERAFRQLHRVLLLSCAIAGLWLFRVVYGYYIAVQMYEQNELLKSQY